MPSTTNARLEASGPGLSLDGHFDRYQIHYALQGQLGVDGRFIVSGASQGDVLELTIHFPRESLGDPARARATFVKIISKPAVRIVLGDSLIFRGGVQTATWEEAADETGASASAFLRVIGKEK